MAQNIKYSLGGLQHSNNETQQSALWTRLKPDHETDLNRGLGLVWYIKLKSGDLSFS